MLLPMTPPPPMPTDGPAADPPPATLDGISLFLDFDGTLVDLAATPDAVVVGADLLTLLDRLAAAAPGRVAIVSGRSLEQLDALIGGFTRTIAVAGSHGVELRLPDTQHEPSSAPAMLDAAFADLDAFAAPRGVLVERKTHGAALHYRHVPEVEPAAVAAAAAIAARTELVLQRGKMMVELRAPGDKGSAVTALLDTPAMRGTVPLFFGDDVTDEDGFAAAAAAGGAGVLIGEARPTAARYALADVAALRLWLASALETAA